MTTSKTIYGQAAVTEDSERGVVSATQEAVADMTRAAGSLGLTILWNTFDINIDRSYTEERTFASVVPIRTQTFCTIYVQAEAIKVSETVLQAARDVKRRITS